MTPAELLAYCLAKPGAWPDQPWEHDTVVKVGPKIFAFVGAVNEDDDVDDEDDEDDEDAEREGEGDGGGGHRVGLKCGRTRVEADEWLHRFPDAAKPSAYIGRFGWNSLVIDGPIPPEEILEAIDASYDAVVAALPKRERPG